MICGWKNDHPFIITALTTEPWNIDPWGLWVVQIYIFKGSEVVGRSMYKRRVFLLILFRLFHHIRGGGGREPPIPKKDRTIIIRLGGRGG